MTPEEIVAEARVLAIACQMAKHFPDRWTVRQAMRVLRKYRQQGRRLIADILGGKR